MTSDQNSRKPAISSTDDPSDQATKPPLSAGLGRHFIINSSGTILGLIVSLVTVPIYIHQIGDARYGVLSIVWLLLGYFGFLDLGLSRAATNALARLGDNSGDERSRIVATTIGINLALGALGSVALYVFGSVLLDRIVSVPAELRPEIERILPWVAALLPLALISGVAIGTLEARDRFLAANVLQVTGSTAGQVIPVIFAIWVSPTLSVVVPAAVLSRALSVVAACAYVYVFNGPWTAARLDRRTAKRLLGYGGWVTVSGIVSPILQSVDQLVIGSILGVAAITYYAVPMNLVIRSQLFAVALSRSLFPRMSRLDREEGIAISEQSFIALAYGYAAICAPCLLLAGPFLALWIGPGFADMGGPVARILFVGAWVNGLAFIPFSLLQAQNRPDLPAKFHLLEVVPFALVLWGLSSAWGLVGAALAWSLRTAVDGGLLFASSRMRSASLLAIAPAAGVMLACYVLASNVPLTLPAAFAVAAAAGFAALALGLLRSPMLAAMAQRSVAAVLPR